MADKYKWIRTWWPVGLVAAMVITSYATLKSDVDSLKADTSTTESIAAINIETSRLDDVKLEKETFVEYKDRQGKEFQEFKDSQKEIKDELVEIKISNARIEEQLKQIIKAVNKK